MNCGSSIFQPLTRLPSFLPADLYWLFKGHAQIVLRSFFAATLAWLSVWALRSSSEEFHVRARLRAATHLVETDRFHFREAPLVLSSYGTRMSSSRPPFLRSPGADGWLLCYDLVQGGQFSASGQICHSYVVSALQSSDDTIEII